MSSLHHCQYWGYKFGERFLEGPNLFSGVFADMPLRNYIICFCESALCIYTENNESFSINEDVIFIHLNLWKINFSRSCHFGQLHRQMWTIGLVKRYLFCYGVSDDHSCKAGWYTFIHTFCYLSYFLCNTVCLLITVIDMTVISVSEYVCL
jgi:hypothetical protein